jgi:hypothetical protein
MERIMACTIQTRLDDNEEAILNDFRRRQNDPPTRAQALRLIIRSLPRMAQGFDEVAGAKKAA